MVRQQEGMFIVSVLQAYLLAAYFLLLAQSSGAAPSSGSREDAAASVATWTSINATGANLSLDGKNSSDELGSVHPAGSTGQKPNSYFYYYTDEMWYVNPTSYVGTLGFICIALVLHIIVCTIRQKPSSSAPPALVAASSDNVLSGEVIPEDAPPPAYSLLYGCLPPPPDYETASKLWQPPPNYKELQPPAPVHRALLS